MCVHSGGEEEKSSKGVWEHSLLKREAADMTRRAKYIESLENRLGRMENLLRLSGPCSSSMPALVTEVVTFCFVLRPVSDGNRLTQRG